MKKLFTLFLAVAAGVETMFAWDYEGVQIGDLYYNLDATSQTAEVARNSSASGDIIIPSSVTYNDTTYSVTSIGDNAFYYCSGLTSVTIPNSVTSIRNYAFSNCDGLTSVTIPNSVTSIGNDAFHGCSGLTSPVYNAHVFAYMPTSYSGAYIIPSGIESIAGGAFYNCTGLTSVTIPNSVTSIGDGAFRNCWGLTSVTIPNSVTSIGDGAFYYCYGLTSITIPNSVTYIGNYAFYYCYGLTSITIPNSVTSIGDYAFVRCTGLTSVTIPNSVTSIGESAFADCTGLTSVTIGNSVTSIGDGAFAGCSGLTSITCEATTPPTLEIEVFNSVDKSIPLYVPAGSIDLYKAADQWKDFTNILPVQCLIASGTCGAGDNLTWELSCDSVLTISGTGAMSDYSLGGAPWYSYRSSIASAIVENGVTSIGSYAFAVCDGLTSVTIPNSVTSIGHFAFYYCSGLTSIEIPNSVTSIGNSAFSNCDGLTSVTIPNSVTSIGEGAFWRCIGLTSVTIPNSVTSIGSYAFEYCSSLTSVTIPNSVTNIGDGAFTGCSNLTSITCEAITPPTLGSDVFSSVDKSIPLYVPAGSIDLYKAADQWKDFTNIRPIEGEFPVVFLDYNSKVLSEQSVVYNQAAEVPEVPAREGYTFVGWNVDIEHIVALTYAIALYEKIGGTLTYLSEEGDVIATENVDLHLPAAPIIAGKSFKGWLTESADSENGIVLRATYTLDNPTTHDDVTITPSSNSAAVIFPFITGALTYQLVIRDLFGNVICKIMFSATGHLLGVAFAPSRNHASQQATETTGFNFTVEGLDANTTYEYEFVANDETDEVIETLSGSFTTMAEKPEGNEQVNSPSAIRKYLEDGHLMIDNNARTFDARGQQVK